MEMLIAEDLLLLLLDDETGAQRASMSSDTLMGGALLVELAARGLVTLGPSSSKWRTEDDVLAIPGAAASDPVLQESLARVAKKSRSAKELLDPLGKGVRDVLTDRLAERGVLHRKDDKVLGLFSRTRWPAADSRHEADVRRRVDQALLHAQRPDQRTAALIALLLGVDELGIVCPEGRATKEIKERAKAIAEGNWASDAVGQAVQDVMNAAMMAVIISTTTTVIITNN
jgi:Golgi phosphoprotein 3 (GPP34)